MMDYLHRIPFSGVEETEGNNQIGPSLCPVLFLPGDVMLRGVRTEDPIEKGKCTTAGNLHIYSNMTRLVGLRVDEDWGGRVP